MKSLLVATLAAALLTLALPHPAPAQVPTGWTTQTAGTQTIYTPPDLKPGEFYRIVLISPCPLGGRSVADFLAAFTAKEAAALGTPTGAAQSIASADPHGAGVSIFFRSKSGQMLAAINSASSLDGKTVSVMSILSSQNLAVLKRYQSQTAPVFQGLLDREKTAFQAAAPAPSMPGAPAGLKPGGPIVPGIYEGDAVYKSDETFTPRHFKLYLYATGELRLFRANGDQIEAGGDDYHYDPASGKIGVSEQYGLNNYDDPARGFCVYGHDPAGKPLVYAERNYPDGDRRTTTLRYAGPPDMLSSKQKQAAKDAADAEARRYKYVTAPGRGIQPSQIAGIYHHFQVPIYGLSRPDFVNYLLLKDGTVHEDLPVAPDEMDAALSRRKEPKQWGRWRRQGKNIEMAWPDDLAHFEAVTGNFVTPAKPGERISGRYGGASSGGSPVTGGYYEFYGVAFTPDGRFSQDRSGGTSSGSLGQTLNGFSVETTSSNGESVTTLSSPGAVGYAKTKKHGSSDRKGTYSVSGYTLTLHYDNGKIKRMPFYFLSPERYFIFFEGDLLKSDAYK